MSAEAERTRVGAEPLAPVGAFSSPAALAILHQLTALGRAIAQARSLDDILQIAATQAANVLGADQTVLMLVGDDGQAHPRAVHGVDAVVAAAFVGPLDERLLQRLEAVLTDDSSRVFMAVPLIVQDEVTGLLAVTREGETPWTAMDEATLAAFADQSAAPIEIARLSEQVRQARLVADNLRLHQAERVARAELDAERTRLSTVLENLPAGVVFAEAPSGRVTFANRAAARLLGLPEGLDPEPTLALLSECLHVKGRPDGSGESPLTRALRGGETVAGEDVQYDRADGTPATFNMNAAAIRDAGGTIVAAVSTFADVTQQRLVQQHLQQIQRMDAVGRLAGGVAHEANNQMQIVLSAAAFVLHRADVPEEVREDIEQIKRAGERTAAVTSQLLSFSRRQIVRPELLSVDRVVTTLAPALRHMLGRSCTLDVRLASGGAMVRADQGQLEQALINLTMNARDAMPDGGRFTLETRPVELGDDVAGTRSGFTIRPGSYLLLTCTDTGAGMDPDTLAHLFEPFFTTKTNGKGTGLGLATVYGIIKQMGGYVWANSAPGQGATFVVHLPIVKDAKVPRPVEAAPIKPVAGEVILVVEDTPAVLAMTVRVLRAAGYDVIEAANGTLALERLERHTGRVDLLVTDVDLSDDAFDGIELATRVRRQFPSLPVVFMSGHPGEAAGERALQHLRSSFLTKPFAPDTLARCVRTLLDKGDTRR
jgi:two-component system, cell cycle sensor histidine kinase and response regulator CckA